MLLSPVLSSIVVVISNTCSHFILFKALHKHATLAKHRIAKGADIVLWFDKDFAEAQRKVSFCLGECPQ